MEEETGWRAGRLEPVGAMHPCIGYSDEVIHIFVATGLEPGRPLADGEVAEVVRLPLADAVRMARTGEIDDAKSVVALVWVWEFVGKGPVASRGAPSARRPVSRSGDGALEGG